MFLDEPSATLPLQLLKRATERAVETGGRPTKAIRRLWDVVRRDPRARAVLGEVGESPEALADWLAATGGDRGLESVLGPGARVGKATLTKGKGAVMATIGGVEQKQKKKSKLTKVAKAAALAAGVDWTVLTKGQRRALKNAVRVDRAARELRKLNLDRACERVTANVGADVSDVEIEQLTKAAGDPSNPRAMFTARERLQQLAASTLTPQLSFVPGVRARQNIASGMSPDGFQKLR